MEKARRKFITIPRLVILVLLVLVLIMGLWLFLRGTLVKGLIGGIENLESQGYEITHGGLTVEGFPFSLEAASKDISIRAPRSNSPDPAKNWSIITDSLSVSSATLTPLSWDIVHNGQMRIDMHGRNGERYWFEVVPANIDARAAASIRGTLKSASFDMGPAQLDSLVGTPPVISKFEQLSGNLHISKAVGHVRLRSSDIRLSPKIPDILDNILGRKLTLVEMNADIEQWPVLEKDGADTWIAANGRMTAEHWAVQWGAADIIGNFYIHFRDGLPEGTIQIRIKEPEPLLAKIFEFIPETQQYAQPVNAYIAMKETKEDGRKVIDLTIKDGVVKMGFIPLPIRLN